MQQWYRPARRDNVAPINWEGTNITMVYKHVVENVTILTLLEYDPVIHGLA